PRRPDPSRVARPYCVEGVPCLAARMATTLTRPTARALFLRPAAVASRTVDASAAKVVVPVAARYRHQVPLAHPRSAVASWVAARSAFPAAAHSLPAIPSTTQHT